MARGLLYVWDWHWWLSVYYKFVRGTGGCGFVISL